MDGPGIGGPRKGMKSLERKLNSEAAKHAMILETRIPDATDTETSAVRAIIARNARSEEEREMLESMLIGERVEMPACQKCGTVWVVQSLVDQCAATCQPAGEGEDE